MIAQAHSLITLSDILYQSMLNDVVVITGSDRYAVSHLKTLLSALPSRLIRQLVNQTLKITVLGRFVLMAVFKMMEAITALKFVHYLAQHSPLYICLIAAFCTSWYPSTCLQAIQLVMAQPLPNNMVSLGILLPDVVYPTPLRRASRIFTTSSTQQESHVMCQPDVIVSWHWLASTSVA